MLEERATELEGIARASWGGFQRTPGATILDRERFLLGLIDRIYAASLNQGSWDEVTRPLQRRLGCSVVALHADDPPAGEGLVVSNCGLAPEEAAKYEAYYVRRNVWLERAAPIVHAGRLFHGEELISQWALRRSEYYNDFAVPNRLGLVMAVCLHHEPDLIAFLSLFKGPGEGSFSAEEVETLRLLTPHLQRAVEAGRTFRRLHAERGLAENALDLISRGALVLDRRGGVIFVNRAMRGILQLADGLSLDRTGLRFARRLDQRRFEAILGREDVRGGGMLRARRPSLCPDYEIVVTPLPGAADAPALLPDERERPGWLVLITDPAQLSMPEHGALRKLYGLTPAEAEVAGELGAGCRLREIAKRRGTSHNTAKTQARAVYQKVGVRNRAELTRRLTLLGAGAPHPNG